MEKIYQLTAGYAGSAYESNGGNIIATITTPAGNVAEVTLYPDERVYNYGLEANVQFSSSNLRFSENLIDKFEELYQLYRQDLIAVEPDNIWSDCDHA